MPETLVPCSFLRAVNPCWGKSAKFRAYQYFKKIVRAIDALGCVQERLSCPP